MMKMESLEEFGDGEESAAFVCQAGRGCPRSAILFSVPTDHTRSSKE